MQAFLSQLSNLVGERWLLHREPEVEPYVVDQRGYYRGKPCAVVRPKDTQQVAEVIVLANQFDIGVVAQGGNTGLCGGATPDGSGQQLVMSLDRLNQIRGVDVIDHSMTVEAGVVLQRIHDSAAENNLFFPLDLAAKGSSQIGGNLSTNAGGINVLRYGNARDLVLGLEVVLADGSIWNGLSNLRKDNTGYDLKQLFIGSEGTLGVITAAVLKLFPKHIGYRTAMLAVKDPQAACRLLGLVRSLSGDTVVSYEYLCRDAMECVLAQTDAKDPLTEGYAHYVLLELAAGASEDFLDRILEEVMQQGIEADWIIDGVLAQNERQRAELWQIRESISTSQRGSVKNDISVPISSMADFLETALMKVKEIAPRARPCPFGHIGDGNLHYNILPPVDQKPDLFRHQYGEQLVAMIAELAMNMRGSFSAEHGVGQLRRDMLYQYKSDTAIDLMQRIKKTLDPKGLLNPGKVI